MRIILIVHFVAAVCAIAQTGAKNGEWPTYGGDLGNTHYSALDQINGSNFNKLEIAWRFKTDKLGPRPEYQLEGTPLMANGIVYATAGTRRDVIALDGATGELLWVHGEREGPRGANAPRQLSGRGLAYWTDGREERILYVTPGYRLIALNAKTGLPVPGFGKDGVVDLKQDDDQEIDPITGEVGLHATPVVAKDVVIVGAAHKSGGVPKSKGNVKGYVRGFDVRTGKRLWIFHTIPKPGEFGLDTWEKDSWSYTGNAGVWGQISVDEDLNTVYLPVETPTGDYFGGHRPGNGLFGERLVAVKLETGERIWHFQFVHHGIWDYDLPCAPILADITVDGRAIKAVAQPTKQGYLFVFDRVTGRPVWPIEERPVPQSDVPGEKTSATQPFPPDKLRYNSNFLKLPDDLIDFTPQLRARALEAIKRYRYEPSPFMPGSIADADGRLGSIVAPTATNWPGGGYDPELHIAFAPAGNVAGVRALRTPPAEFSDIRYVAGVNGRPFQEILGPGDCCAA